MRDRDKDDIEEQEPLFPVAGSAAPIFPLVPDPHTIDDQIPDEEKDAGDELIAPDDDALLEAGHSPEFDHSLRRRKPTSKD